MADGVGGLLGLRVTMPVLAVLDVLVRSTRAEPVWGLLVCRESGYGPGTVYPILGRLGGLGWVESWAEPGRPSGRPRRRYHVLTDAGRVGRRVAWQWRSGRSSAVVPASSAGYSVPSD